MEEFCRDARLSDQIPLFQKGALVAQDPAAFENVIELDQVERAALRDEVLYRWRQPRALYLTVILCSVGAAVQGWDQTGSNGANLSWPVALGVPDTDSANPNTDTNSWIIGVVNAAPYISSAFMCVLYLLFSSMLIIVTVAAGCLTLSTTTSAVAVPFLFLLCSAYYPSLAQHAHRHGRNCSSPVCCLG